MSFLRLLDTTGFPPRWSCGSAWRNEPFWGWLHIGSDVAVGTAYMAIPILLTYFLKRRPDLPFPRILWLFVAFIFACGTVHLVEAMIFWWPIYRVSGLVKLSTAVISWITVVALVPLIPTLLAFRTPAQLEEIVRVRTDELQTLTAQLRQEAHQRANMTRQLKENESRLRLALLAGGMGTWDWDLRLGQAQLDTLELELTGLSPQSTRIVPVNDFFERVHPDDRDGLQEAIRQATDEGKEYDHEFRVRAQDGSFRWMAGRGVVERDASGQAVRMRGVNFDVTDRKVNHRRLAENESFLRSVLQSSHDAIKVLDLDGRLLSMNKVGMASMHIDDFNEIKGSHWQSLWPEECIEKVQESLEAARHGKVGRFEGNRPTMKGIMRTWDVVCTPIAGADGRPRRLLCVSRDITEIRNATDALRESEERFRTLANNIAQFAWMTDETGWIFWYNQRWFDYTGTTLEQMKGWGWRAVHHPDHVNRVVDKIKRCFESGEVWEDTFPLRSKNGEYRWFLSRAMPIRDKHGKVVLWFGTNTDVTELRAAESALAEALTQLKAIVDTAADAIITVDEDNLICSANAAVRQVFGYVPEEVTNRRLEILIPEFAENPKICKGREVEGLRADGRTFPLEVSFSETVTGDRRAFMGIMRDITSRKQTEEVLRVRNRAIEFATCGILIADAQTADHPIVYANPAFEELTGYRIEDVRGRNCRLLQGPDTDPDQVRLLRQAIRSRDECHVTILNYRKDGSRFWNDLRVSPVEDDHGRVTHFVGIQSDITGRIRYEQRLKEAQELANSSNRAKSEFLANMSHEIRTPLTALLGCADALYRQLEDPESKDVVRMIRGQGQLLMGILNDVLDLSKIEAGKLEIRKSHCEIMRIVGDIHSLMHAQAVEQGIQLHTKYLSKVPEWIETDPLRLRQILLNLVGNAIKFTEKGGVEIAVSCQPVGQHAGIEISVTDTGIGIPADRLASIFEAFSQAENHEPTRASGTGLGLTICQRLARMLGGTIEVESILGRGSKFTVNLPLGEIDPATLKDPNDCVRSSAFRESDGDLDVFIPCRVLIVEDTRGIQFMMTRMLQDVVSSLEVTSNGEDAIRVVKRSQEDGTPFDVILMDMQMPVLNGFDAARMLRQQGFQAPIIALTAGAMAGDREKCLAAGCTDYLTKPIDRRELLAKLRHYGDP